MPDLHGWITQQIDRVEALAREQESSLWQVALGDDSVAAAVLRRCTADRKILARHQLDPDVTWTPACKGCGTYGDQELPEVDNLNDCPELLDLAHAHSLTPEILATLDQPETPARPERPDIPPPVHLNALVRLLSARPTSSVPPALRGPNWPGSG